MKDSTRYNLKTETPADPFAGRAIAQKRYEQLVAGDHVWWSGQLVEVVKPLKNFGFSHFRHFKAEFITGPLKGTDCHICGLAYGHVPVENAHAVPA